MEPGTPHVAPWPSKAGDALQTGDARGQDYTKSHGEKLYFHKCFVFMLEKLCSASYWCRKGFDLAVPEIPRPTSAHDEGEKGNERKQQAAQAIAPLLTPSLMQEKARKRRI